MHTHRPCMTVRGSRSAGQEQERSSSVHAGEGAGAAGPASMSTRSRPPLAPAEGHVDAGRAPGRRVRAGAAARPRGRRQRTRARIRRVRPSRLSRVARRRVS